MAIRILFFAQSAAWAGRRELERELPRPATIAELLDSPELSGLKGRLSGTRFALNGEFSPERALVQDGDEVAVVPPVSGG